MADQDSFARLVGVHPAVLRGFEAGGLAPDLAPRRLAALAPELDWVATGLGAPGDPCDRTARHPSAGGGRARRGGAR